MRPTIRSAAEADILRQAEWYAERAGPDVARRFQRAVLDALEAILHMPDAGAPKTAADARLSGLRTWPLRGFDDLKIYYLAGEAGISILRVLHGRRDIDQIMDGDRG